MDDDSLLDEILTAEAAAGAEDVAAAGPDEPVTEEELTAEHRLSEEPPEAEFDEGAAAEDDEGEGAAGDLGLVQIRQLAGIPLFYQGNFPSPRPHRPFVARSFVGILEATVRQTQARVPASYGRLQRIQEIGMFVRESDKLHTRGRACDWEKLIFEHAVISPGDGDHAAASRARRCRYWAFGAICRSNSCFVLHGLYNAAHENHIHHDDGISTAFNTRPATVKLCQAILNDVFAHAPKVEVNGAFDEPTQRALQGTLHKLQIAGTVEDTGAWTQFLRTSARLGFRIGAPT